MLNDIITFTPQAQSMHLNFGQLAKSPSIAHTARINPNNNSLNNIKQNNKEKELTRAKSKEEDSKTKDEKDGKNGVITIDLNEKEQTRPVDTVGQSGISLPNQPTATNTASI